MQIANNKKIFIGVTLFVVITMFGVITYRTGLNQGRKDTSLTTESQTPGVTAETSSIPVLPPPCSLQPGPDGNLTEVCEIRAIIESPTPSLGGGLSPRGIPLSSGTGTTTLNKKTPLNDILIAETGSPNAFLRNARYIMWPYPDEIPIKEIYIILPEIYEPIFPGYSNSQLVELSDGSKHILIYLRHKESAYSGANARIFIQSPSPTNETDHPLTQFDSTESWTGFSIVSKGQEVVVEVFFSEEFLVPPPLANMARQELLESVKRMEIIW